MRRLYQFALAIGFGLMLSGSAMAQAKGAPTAPAAPGRTSATAGARFYNGYGQTPWFGSTTVQQHLNMTPNQYQQLNRAYGNAWNTFSNSLSNTGNLSGNQLNNQMQQYYNTFNNSLNKAAQGTLTPQQLQRYQQLNWQYQGYNAFNNPAVQQELNLTAAQRQQFNKYAQQFNQNLNGMFNNKGGNANAYNQLRTQMNQRINSILTPQQQQAWQRMTGAPYNFVPPFTNP